MEFEILTTERLILKKLTPEGFSYLFENYSDDEIKKQLGLTTEEDLVKEKAKLQGGYTTYDKTILAFLLVLKSNNETIGRCGYHNWYRDHHKAEIGYALNKEEHKRKGYMSESLKTILEHGFNSMNLNRIEACISPANSASQNLIKKYGFTQEGYLRQHFVRNGEVQDSLIFSLLKEEYVY
ncbi:MAG: alanine acetyltransferase [Bacteroidetes bacterium]|nr:alanine acetyltransferase [Bacteroidota bacterium]